MRKENCLYFRVTEGKWQKLKRLVRFTGQALPELFRTLLSSAALQEVKQQLQPVVRLTREQVQ
jgi:16S rRNA U516 pseudouridylate synthase RsuA-like enzyme